MTKSKKLSTIFIAILLIALFTGCTKAKERKYSSNSGDTVISFGDTDGRFSIFRAGGWCLGDSKDTPMITIIDMFITNYKDISPYAYTVGEKGYTKLNYNNGKIIQSKNLKDFTDVDMKIFKKLKLKDLTK